MKGSGIGPRGSFSETEIDFGDLFVGSRHFHNVELLNDGEIEIKFELVENSTDEKLKKFYTFEPCRGITKVVESSLIKCSVEPSHLGLKKH